MKRTLTILLAALLTLSCLSALAEAVENDCGAYRVIVRDRNGDPVEGAVIQFCDDVTCSFQPTDASGVATFSVAEQKVYEVHVLQAPEDCIGTDDVYHTLETWSDVVIVLEKVDQAEQDQTERVFEAKKSGLTLVVPDAYKATKGTVEYSDLGDDTRHGDGVVEMIASYIPMSEATYRDLWERMEAADEADDLDTVLELLLQINDRELFSIYGINDGRGIDELIEYLLSQYDPEKASKLGITRSEEETAALKERVLSYRYSEIGSYDGFTYILQTMDPERVKRDGQYPGYEGGYYEEYIALLENVDQIATHIRLTGGVELTESVEYAEVGTALHFETTDLEGNPVKSEDLFAGYAVTMINLWGTWCNPCKRELPELDSLNRELAEKNCRIIGIVTDAKNDEKIGEAKAILAEKGVSYVNLLPFEGLSAQLPQQTWPTSYFVDENGTLIGEPITGAYLEQYRETFASLLMERE